MCGVGQRRGHVWRSGRGGRRGGGGGGFLEAVAAINSWSARHMLDLK